MSTMKNPNSTAASEHDCRIPLLLLSLMTCLVIPNDIYSQESQFKNSAITTGIGFGNHGSSFPHMEGRGLVFSLGWQKSIGEKNKIRINPNLIYSEYRQATATDMPSRFYNTSSIGLDFQYDIIRYRFVSLMAVTGVFYNYSRGIVASFTTMEGDYLPTRYIHSSNVGWEASLGLRVEPKNWGVAFEVKPLTLRRGSSEYIMAYLMLGMDIKLKRC